MSSAANIDMREYWNGAGGERWLRFQDITDESLLPLGLKAIAAAGIAPGDTVLDIGCGCGDTSLELARRAGPDGRVLGVDISAPILERARLRALPAADGNVAFECGDAQVQRFEEGAFNVVFSRFGVMFFEDAFAAFKNLRRALRPGGRLAFICWQPTIKNEWFNVALEAAGRHVPLPAPAAADEPGPLSLSDPERVNRILTAAEFSDIAIDSFETPFTIGRNLEQAVTFLTQMGPARAAIVQSDADDTIQTRIVADLSDALTPYDTGQGITLGAATWIVTAINSSA